MVDTRHPPFPPAPPRPPMGQSQQPMGQPQPMGQMPPRPPVAPPGMPQRPVNMPPGAGRPPMPPHGMKMPQRPMGAPPMGKRPMGAPPAGGVPMMKTPQGDFVPYPGHLPPSPYQQAPVFPEQAEEDDSLLDVLDEEEIIDEKENEAEEEDEENIRFEPSPYDDNIAADMGLPASFVKTKILIPLFLLFILIGIGTGMFIGNPRQVISEELPGVVSNPEIPKGRPRCGLAQKGQGCVLYLMNAQRREAEAKEFFGIAADMLGIPKFQIETANIRYATTRVPPGYIALFNIPPVQ